MHERALLEVRVSGLQQEINCGINTQEEQTIFEQNAAAINDNKNFKYTVTDHQRVQVQLPTGTYTTNCMTCNYTCNYSCGIPRSEDKKGCAAITNGTCRERSNRYHRSRYINDRSNTIARKRCIRKQLQGNPKSLTETRNWAEQINKMAKPGYDCWEIYREIKREIP